MPKRKIPWTPEKLAAAQERGRRQGLINDQNGTLKRASELSRTSRSQRPRAPREKHARKHVLVKDTESYRRNGLLVGGRNAANGWLDKIRTYESAALGGRVVSHNRWHVARGVTNPRCRFCAGEDLPNERSDSETSEPVSTDADLCAV